MKKENKFISILLLILIVIGSFNLVLGISINENLRELIDLSAVKITEFYETSVKEEMTFLKEETQANTTEEAKITEEVTKERAENSEKEANTAYCYVTASGTKYHKESCSYLSKSKTKLTIEEAKNSGYLPCSRCY